MPTTVPTDKDRQYVEYLASTSDPALHFLRLLRIASRRRPLRAA